MFTFDVILSSKFTQFSQGKSGYYYVTVGSSNSEKSVHK